MGYIRKPSLLVAIVIAVACSAPVAPAAGLPSDLCSLLSAADVSGIVGSAYGAAQSSVAPAPFAGTNTGTDCYYSAKGAGHQLWFRIYVDDSPAQATDLFARLKMFYSPPTPVAGIGDEAYFDPSHAIHVRKGKVRYYLDLGNQSSAESALHNLASLVAGKL
ncbi:MAG: hypothetical protein ABSB50_11025 [Terracidiphilus sp.]|jgi:hypothetical protein